MNPVIIIIGIVVYLLTRKSSPATLPNTAMNLKDGTGGTGIVSPLQISQDIPTPGFTIGDTSNYQAPAASFQEQAKEVIAKIAPAAAAAKGAISAIAAMGGSGAVTATVTTATAAIPASLAPTVGLLPAGSIPAGGFAAVTVPEVVAAPGVVAQSGSAAAVAGGSTLATAAAVVLPIAIIAWVAAAWGVFEPYDPHAGSQQITLKDGRSVWISNDLFDELAKGNTDPLNNWLANERKKYDDSIVYTRQTQQAVETKANVIQVTTAIAKKTGNTNTRL